MRATPAPPTSGTATATWSGRKRLGNLVQRASGAVDLGVATAGRLQLLPDSTLQGLAATSIGLGAGLHVAGMPRLVTAAAITPAMIIGAAIALRPPTRRLA
jgi:hypothetical protein